MEINKYTLTFNDIHLPDLVCYPRMELDKLKKSRRYFIENIILLVADNLIVLLIWKYRLRGGANYKCSLLNVTLKTGSTY